MQVNFFGIFVFLVFLFLVFFSFRISTQQNKLSSFIINVAHEQQAGIIN